MKKIVERESERDIHVYTDDLDLSSLDDIACENIGVKALIKLTNTKFLSDIVIKDRDYIKIADDNSSMKENIKKIEKVESINWDKSLDDIYRVTYGAKGVSDVHIREVKNKFDIDIGKKGNAYSENELIVTVKDIDNKRQLMELAEIIKKYHTGKPKTNIEVTLKTDNLDKLL